MSYTHVFGKIGCSGLSRVPGELLRPKLAATTSAIMKTTRLPTYVYGSLTRISDLQEKPFDVKVIDRQVWATGDYVVGRYLGVEDKRIRDKHQEELADGTLQKLVRGDLVVGSLGCRAATQEVVGDWHLIPPHNNNDDNNITMHGISGSGMFGWETSYSPYHFPSPEFHYQGHVVRDGRKVRMKDFVPKGIVSAGPPGCPTILLVGTSMSSGKTRTAQTLLRLLQDFDYQRIVVSKLTGCGYYHDIHESSHDAYAALDFVDAGLPSTVMSAQSYRNELHTMFGLISTYDPDCLIVELGASPWEPYNGSVVMEEMFRDTRHRPFMVLCASDTYSVIGFHTLLSRITSARADVVCGIATNTSAGIAQIKQLTGLDAVCLEEEVGMAKLDTLLKAYLMR